MSAQSPLAVPPHHCSCPSSTTAPTSPGTHSELLIPPPSPKSQILKLLWESSQGSLPCCEGTLAGTKLLRLPHPGSPISHSHLSERCQGCTDTHTSPGQLFTHILGAPDVVLCAQELSDAVPWDSHEPWLGACSLNLDGASGDGRAG